MDSLAESSQSQELNDSLPHLSTRSDSDRTPTLSAQPKTNMKKAQKEKVVRFASESDTVSNNEYHTESESTWSEDPAGLITWIPSENLYSDDTFVSESQKDSISGYGSITAQTEASYGTSTFVDLDSEDETRTHIEYSYSDSFASSDIFSQSQSDRPGSRRWRETTEIVRDIEELEDSKISTISDLLQDEETESDAEEAAKLATQKFLLSSIRKLKLKNIQSSDGLDHQSESSREVTSTRVIGHATIEQTTFCKKIIESYLSKNKLDVQEDIQTQPRKLRALEFYGLSSDILDKLKYRNFQEQLKKNLVTMETDTKKSLQFVQEHQHVNDNIERQQFVSHLKHQLVAKKVDNCIQSHLIQMHPVKLIAELVNTLPRYTDTTDHILAQYQQAVESKYREG